MRRKWYVILLITHLGSRMKQLSILLIAFLVVGCVAATKPPVDLFVSTPQLLKQRQLETRRYDGIAEMELISACSNVLQDLGFSLENSETKLGVITASKERDATNAGEIAAAVAVAVITTALFVPVIQSVSKDQTIRVSLVTRPVLDSDNVAMLDSHFVRITFQTIVRKTDDSIRYETLTDPELYQGFYSSVSKAVFLEAQKI
jgi:hypothetical protein